MTHYISVLVKEPKSPFYIGYLIYTNALVLLIRALHFLETACAMWHIKISWFGIKSN